MKTPLPSAFLVASSIGFKEGEIALLMIIAEPGKKQQDIEVKVDPLVLASLGARISQILGAFCERVQGNDKYKTPEA